MLTFLKTPTSVLIAPLIKSVRRLGQWMGCWAQRIVLWLYVCAHVGTGRCLASSFTQARSPRLRVTVAGLHAAGMILGNYLRCPGSYPSSGIISSSFRLVLYEDGYYLGRRIRTWVGSPARSCDVALLRDPGTAHGAHAAVMRWKESAARCHAGKRRRGRSARVRRCLCKGQ